MAPSFRRDGAAARPPNSHPHRIVGTSPADGAGQAGGSRPQDRSCVPRSPGQRPTPPVYSRRWKSTTAGAAPARPGGASVDLDVPLAGLLEPLDPALVVHAPRSAHPRQHVLRRGGCVGGV